MRTLLVMVVGAAACGSSSGRDGKSAPAAPAVASPGETAPMSFTIIENGRPVITPAADGSFTVDGPSTFVIAADGSLTKDGSRLIHWSGNRIQAAGGAELAEATEAGLRFGSHGELVVGADGKVSAPASSSGTETFQVQGLTDANRRAVLTILTWLMVGTTPPSADAGQASATEADCRRLIDRAIELGVMQSPDGSKDPPPPEVRDALAKQCAEAGMEAEALQCFTAATNAEQWAACDKKY